MKIFKSPLLWLFGVIAAVGVLAYLFRPAEAHETFVFSQDRLAAETETAIRVAVLNRRNGEPIEGASVRFSLTDSDGRTSGLGSFSTDEGGTISEGVLVPSLPPGEYRLEIATRSRRGSDRIERNVTVYRPLRVLLTTDKPIYQPGQTIHLRALATNPIRSQPAANERLRFEVRNADGALVFRDERAASRFGIASTDFALADEVSLGRYEIRVYYGEEYTSRSVEVMRYVLPRFRVELEIDRAFFRPGDEISGTLSAEYFFGQPVSAATVVVRAFSLEEEEREVGRIEGRTDDAGDMSFSIQLPDFFAGRPEMAGQAFLELEAEVVDTAGQAGRAVRPLTLSATGLTVDILPESGQVVPGVENDFVVLVSYPDGRPAAAEVEIDGERYATGEDGVLVWSATPEEDFSVTAIARAVDGATASATFQANGSFGRSPLLVRTDKAVYRTGEIAEVTVYSTEEANRVFFDAIRERQTVLTRSFPMRNRTARFTVPLPSDITGLVRLNVYVISPGGQTRGQTRTIFVSPADGLQVETRLDREGPYRPGDDAQITFSVHDAEGAPTPGAIGISVIDESVLHVQPVARGLLQDFLDTETDIQKPRYQIAFRVPPLMALTDDKHRQALAAAWLQSLSEPRGSPLDELVDGGLIPRAMLDHLRELRDRDELEFFRDHRQFGPIVELIEGAETLYPIRVATGARKVMERERARERTVRVLVGGAFGLGLLAFLVLPVYLSVASAARTSNAIREDWNSRSRETAYSLLRSVNLYLIAASVHLIVPPIVFFTFVFLDDVRWGLNFISETTFFWTITVVEAAALLVIFSKALLSIPAADDTDGPRIRSVLITSAWLYLAGFALLRGSVPWAYHHFDEHGVLLLWFAHILLPLLTGLIVRFKGGKWMRRKSTSWPGTGFPIVQAFIWFFLVILLISGFVPTVSKVRESARRTVHSSDLRQIEQAMVIRDNERDSVQAQEEASGESPRVRRDFPETLLWAPELITDDAGRVTLDLALADSITTWLGTYDIVDARGRMGQGEVRVPVFQSFFVDLDLPVALSLEDEVALPVVCYNYLDREQTVRLRFEEHEWFEPLGDGAEVTVHLGPGEVRAIHFPLRAVQVGEHPFLVTAIGERESDAIERIVRVVPTGRRFETVFNEALGEGLDWSVHFPANAIPGSESLLLKLYPSRFSEVLDGMDGLLRVPFGCFEQTSSVNYPNVLVLAYLEETETLTPEVEVRARKLINTGYQRLLTFQTPEGGFDWFGRSPANVWLTAYGVRQFTDMARIHSVDPSVTASAMDWLYGEQAQDGSWNSRGFGSRQLTTAYTVWSLASANQRGQRVQAGAAWLRRNAGEFETPYETALAANALLALDRSDATGRAFARRLVQTVQSVEGGAAYWTAGSRSIARSSGSAADVEATALAALVLLNDPATVPLGLEAVSWISRQRTSWGHFGSTQATILSIQALLKATSTVAASEETIRLAVSLNEDPVESLEITPEEYEVMRLISLTSKVVTGENAVRLQTGNPSDLGVQLAASYWVRDDAEEIKPDPLNAEALSIEVSYDRGTLSVNDLLTAHVTVVNETAGPVFMPLIDLGVPPGFELLADSLDILVARERIARYEITGNQLILYLHELPVRQPFQFSYQLRAKHPLRVTAPTAAIYDYYNPEVRSESAGTQIEVR